MHREPDDRCAGRSFFADMRAHNVSGRPKGGDGLMEAMQELAQYQGFGCVPHETVRREHTQTSTRVSTSVGTFPGHPRFRDGRSHRTRHGPGRPAPGGCMSRRSTKDASPRLSPGTLSPSRCHSRSTRLSFTCQPASRSMAACCPGRARGGIENPVRLRSSVRRVKA